MTSGVPEAFGFVPAHVVADLQDIGNWKSRATAIDALHKCLKDVAQPAVLAPSLPDFVSFLGGLIGDPNFKISISAMSILGDLATKVGSKLERHLREVVPSLLEKLMDSKILVRGAAVKVLRKLMNACTPTPVLALLEAGAGHSNWRVREEIVNTLIVAMLSLDRSALDMPSLYRVLTARLADGKDRVRVVALEGLAVLGSKLGPGELAGWVAGQRGAPGGAAAALSEGLRAQVTARLARSALPALSSEGLVEHVTELPAGDNPDVRLADAAGGKPLWGDTATPSRSRPRYPSEPPVYGADGSRPVAAAPAPTLEQVGRLGSDPLPGSRRAGLNHGGAAAGVQHSDELGGPGGGHGYKPVVSQPYGAPPSRFSSQEALGGGAPITAAPALALAANGHGNGRLQPSSRSASPGREVLSSASDGPLLERDRGSAGALHPLKHHWGASRPQDAPGMMGRSPGESSDDSPLSPSKGFHQLVHNRHAGHTGLDGGPDMLGARPPSVRTQAAAELREARGGGGSGGHMLPHPHPHLHPHPPPSSLGLWLQSSMEQENAGRQETFSPSKAEMLARLKNRQIEKRAATAQQGDMATSSFSASDLALASHSGDGPPPRRYLHTQLSDHQRDRSGSGTGPACDAPSRGYNSVVNTPTRAAGGPAGNPFDEGAPSSAAYGHRPPRSTPLATRLGRGTSLPAEGGGQQGYSPASASGQTRSPNYQGAYASPSEDSPVRNPSPALNRLRVRSADPPPGAAGPLATSTTSPNGTAAGGAGAGGSYWEKGRGGGEVGSEELSPVPDPERHIKTVISRLVEANHADRKELDWQGQYDALTDARRLVRHHPDVVRACLHDFVRAATPAIDQLRSQTSKCALALIQECFALLGRAMDRELDEMVPVLVKKAGEVSNAGRDNFLAAEADRALAEMYRCCGEARSVTALLGCAGHKNPYVRGKVAFHLDNLLEGCAGAGGGGSGKAGLGGNSACLERLFKAAAGFLDEGSLDTRTYGKRIIWHIKGMMGSRGEFDRLVAGVSPAGLQRKVVDVVEGLNGPPAPPSRGPGGATAAGAGGGATGVGSRLASRQLSPGMGGAGAGGSLTQPPPPPVRQGSYSAPSPVHSGAATPERRRLGRQRTNDLDGIPEGAAGAGGGGLVRVNSGNGRLGRVSAGGAGAGAPPPGAPPPGGRTRHAASADGTGNGYASAASAGAVGAGGGAFTPAAQETVVKALQMLGAKDFRERMEALRSVEGVVSALGAAPDSLLMSLLDGLVARVGDANAKVSLVALELVSGLTFALRQRMSLGLNTLVPALAAALGSANDKIRTLAATATDALLGTLDPAMLVQHLSHCVANGTLQRGKPILVDKLVALVNVLYGSKPTLVARYAVPAAFTLLNDTRGGSEGKAAANALLAALARLMGDALLDQAGSLNAVSQQRVADAVAAATGGGGRGGGYAGMGGGGGMDRVPRGGMMGRTAA